VKEALKKIKTGKALGPDNIPIEAVAELHSIVLGCGPLLNLNFS
jgi:hypothetical protein